MYFISCIGQVWEHGESRRYIFSLKRKQKANVPKCEQKYLQAGGRKPQNLESGRR